MENYGTYIEPLSKKWMNGRLSKHVAYTIFSSAVKLLRKWQHPIFWVGLIN